MKTETGTQETIYKYRAKSAQNNDINYYPRYVTKPYRKPGNISFLQQNFSSITKITTQHIIHTPLDKSHSFFSLETLTRLFTGIPEGALSNMHERHIETTFPIEFNSRKQLQMIIDNWQTELSTNSYNDYGFKLKGSSEVIWLSSTLAKEKYNFDIKFDENSVISASSLLNEVSRYADQILRLSE